MRAGTDGRAGGAASGEGRADLLAPDTDVVEAVRRLGPAPTLLLPRLDDVLDAALLGRPATILPESRARREDMKGYEAALYERYRHY